MNMKIRYLTPREQALLDPSGRARDAIHRRFPDKETTGKPSPCLKRTSEPEMLLEQYKTIFQATCDRHEPILVYDREMTCKFGPQGGNYTFSTLLTMLDRSYELAQQPHASHDVLDMGLASLLALLRNIRDAVGYPSVTHEYFCKPTSGGLPTMCGKETWLAHVTGAAFWRHPWPDLPGARRQRNKNRLIHEDATLNIDYIQPYLTAVRKWLVRYCPEFFGVWQNPTLHTHPVCSRTVLRRWISLETDFKGMDEHFSLFIVQRYILPVYEILLTEAEYWHFSAFIVELFEQPVFLGTMLGTGLHNLFSGQAITQDFETIFSVILYMGASLAAGLQLDDWYMVAVGDDVVYSVKNSRDAERVYDYVLAATNACGLVLEPTKTRIDRGVVRFCRQVYYPALPVRYNEAGQPYLWPAYPPVLALNSIVWPESPLPPTLEMTAILARLHNLEGYYQWRNFCNWMFSKLNPGFEVTKDSIETIGARDWWRSVYGVDSGFSESSPVLQWWRQFTTGDNNR